MDTKLRYEESYAQHPEYSNLTILEGIERKFKASADIKQLAIYRKLLTVITDIKIRMHRDIYNQIIKELE